MDTGQVYTCSQSIDPNYISKGLIKAESIWALSNQGQAHILTHVLSMCPPPTCEHAHPGSCAVVTSKLIYRRETHDLLSYVNNSFQYSRKWSVLGQLGAYRLEAFFFL